MKTKLEFKPGELEQYASEGRTVLVQYRTAFNILFSRGVAECILSPIGKKYSGLPYTQRGRFQAVTPETFRALQSL